MNIATINLNGSNIILIIALIIIGKIGIRITSNNIRSNAPKTICNIFFQSKSSVVSIGEVPSEAISCGEETTGITVSTPPFVKSNVDNIEIKLQPLCHNISVRIDFFLQFRMLPKNVPDFGIVNVVASAL